jgi:hypothetical protein
MPICGEQLKHLQAASLGCTYGEDHPAATAIHVSRKREEWDNYLNSLVGSDQKKTAERLRKLREKIATETLRSVYGSHSFLSSFDGIDFGANRNGIHRATVADILHTIEEGLIPNLLKVFYGLMSDGTRTNIDGLVEDLFSTGRNRSGERVVFPKVSFTRGYTALTLLSANERLGQLFVLAILLNIQPGRKVLAPRFAENFDEERQKSRERTSRKYQILEEVLEEEGEEEQEDEAEEEDDGNGGIQAGVSTDSERELKGILDSIDLRFIQRDAPKDLPEKHREILWEVLRRNLTANNASARDARDYAGKEPFNFRRGQLDYMDTGRRGEGNNRTTLYESFPRATSDEGTLEPDSISMMEEEEVGVRRSLLLDMDSFKQLVEGILTMHATLKYAGSEISVGDNLRRLRSGIEWIRVTIRDGVKRDESTNGYRTEKFLELSHFYEDYMEYGVASGYSTETGERGLKDWAKKPARRARQGTDEIFTGQTCTRIQETALLRKLEEVNEAVHGKSLFRNDNKDKQNEDGPSTDVLYDKTFVFHLQEGERATIRRVLPNGNREKYKRNNNSRGYPKEVIDWFENMTSDKAVKVTIFSEMKVGGVLFRAHPNYQSNGPWFDYAMIQYQYGRGEEVRTKENPARIAAFFYQEEAKTGVMITDPTVADDNGWRVLVQECHWQGVRHTRKKSMILDHYTLKSKPVEGGGLEAKFEVHMPSAINRRIYCMEEEPLGGVFSKPPNTSFDIVVIREMRSEWHKQFLNMGEN